MSSVGLLKVRATYAEGGLRQLAVDLKRPTVTRLFIGQHPAAVVKTIPYIYTVCAHAQRAASRAALDAASGGEARPAHDSELWIELLHENLWRLLLDWPPALGLPPAKDAFAAWRAERRGEHGLAATRRLLADTLSELADKCLQALDGGSPAGPHDFPELDPEAWLAYWQGAATSAPARRPPASIGAAYAARLAEIEMATAALASAAPYPLRAAGGDGWGVGQTVTARGVLTHAVQVYEGKVMNYRVWAPTDCHFADAAALAGLLDSVSASDYCDARKRLDLAVLALDPCLPYVVELQHA